MGNLLKALMSLLATASFLLAPLASATANHTGNAGTLSCGNGILSASANDLYFSTAETDGHVTLTATAVNTNSLASGIVCTFALDLREEDYLQWQGYKPDGSITNVDTTLAVCVAGPGQSCSLVLTYDWTMVRPSNWDPSQPWTYAYWTQFDLTAIMGVDSVTATGYIFCGDPPLLPDLTVEVPQEIL